MDDQLTELRELVPGVQQAAEGSVVFYLLPDLSLPLHYHRAWRISG
jgi:hypothetical protein